MWNPLLYKYIQRIAQLESEQIGERVYAGMEQKAKTNSGVLGFNIPYGYDYNNGILKHCLAAVMEMDNRFFTSQFLFL